MSRADPSHRPVVVLRHVSWEGPHRLLDAFEDLPVMTVAALDAEVPVAPHEAAGAIVMGGPPNVDEVDRYPHLAEERRWLELALESGTPTLGVCLGAQLIARALGAPVRQAAVTELGWAPVEVLDDGDPVIGPLAPVTTVLHWHRDVFDLPPGATLLARSGLTACQAFRYRSAWGLLFHPEADERLVSGWLAEPTMAVQARETLGLHAQTTLLADSRSFAPVLQHRSSLGFKAFADLCRRRQREPPDGRSGSGAAH